MIQSITTNDGNRPLQWFIWQLNLHCPFHCYYCNEFTWGDKRPARFTWDVYNRMCDEIIERYEYGHIELTGGEPLYFPYIDQVIDKFYKAGFTVGVFTNLGKNIEAYKNWLGKLVYIAASYHPDVIKTNEQRESWFSRAKQLAKDIPIVVRCMLDPKHFDHCLDVMKTLSVEDIKMVEPVRLMKFENEIVANPDTADEYYTKEQNDIIDQLELKTSPTPFDRYIPNEVIIDNVKYKDTEVFTNLTKILRSRENKFKDWSCDIGTNSLHIRGDGMVAKGGCHCYDNKFIGSIDKPDNIQWPIESTICPYDLCHCDADVFISKRAV